VSRLAARVKKLEEETVTQNQVCLIGNMITTSDDLRRMLKDMPASTGLPEPSTDTYDDEAAEQMDFVVNKVRELEALLNNQDCVFVEEYQAMLTRDSLDEMKQHITYWPINTGLNQTDG